MNYNLEAIIAPKSVAVVGASRDPGKIGHTILKNFVDGGFAGKVFPVNPKAEELLGLRCYASVGDIKEKVDCAVIAVPAAAVPGVLRECGEKGLGGAVVISGGFSEVGNTKGEEEIASIAKEYGLAVIGPNCLGVLNPATRFDCIFLPLFKMGRPPVGDIGFMSQSGAVGSCIVDLAAHYHIGVSKFVSYGNATVIDEADLLRYFAEDPQTRIIVGYIEGVRRGKEFFSALKEVAKQKPTIFLKAGVSRRGAEATLSHTGSLAGSAEAYRAVFKQAKAIEAHTLMELFYFAKAFDQPLPQGRRVGVITNGGGYAVLAADAIEEFHLELAEFSEKTKKALEPALPSYANLKNPLDLVGDADAERYRIALEALMADDNIDILVITVLFQTVSIDSRVVNVIAKAADERRKPIIVVSTGGEYTELHRRILESYRIPTYHSPTAAMKAAEKLADFADLQRKLGRMATPRRTS
ncbi:MAG: CoA-binding protein [Candidatus Micrarchaeia archaeon]